MHKSHPCSTHLPLDTATPAPPTLPLDTPTPAPPTTLSYLRNVNPSFVCIVSLHSSTNAEAQFVMQSLDQCDLLQPGGWGNVTDQKGNGLTALYQQRDGRLMTSIPHINTIHLQRGGRE